MAFTKQHYTRIANILSKFNGKGIEELVGALIVIFKEDNPRFLIDKFLEASGFAGNTRVKYEENISSTGGKTPFKKMVNEAFENFGMKLMPMLPVEQTIPKNLNEDLVDKIMAYEDGSLDDKGILDLFSELIRTGKIQGLQGAYGRMEARLIDGGYLDKKGKILKKVNETPESKKYQQNQMITKARATADPKDAYQQYLSQHRASKSQKPPMTYDEWYLQWKEKKDECSKEKLTEVFENFGMKIVPLIPVGKITTLRHGGSAESITEKTQYRNVFKTRSGVEYNVEQIEHTSGWIVRVGKSGKIAVDTDNFPWVFKSEKEAIDTVEKKWR